MNIAFRQGLMKGRLSGGVLRGTNGRFEFLALEYLWSRFIQNQYLGPEALP